MEEIVKEVTREWKLPLEESKQERLIFWDKRRKKSKDVKWVKWLGIILDENLTFENHWKSRIARVRKFMAKCNGIRNSQWGISLTSWKQFFTGSIQAIAMWGAELGWREQKDWESGIESPRTALDACQGRMMVRIMANPDSLGDLMPDEGCGEGNSLAEILVGRAVVTVEGDEWALSYGGLTSMYSVSVMDLGCEGEDEVDRWEEEIRFQGVGREVWYSDGSIDEGGGVGGGSWNGNIAGSVGMGRAATVWDGEIADSQVAIKSLVKAEKRGRARTHDMVKAHTGIEGNERADRLAKSGPQRKGDLIGTRPASVVTTEWRAHRVVQTEMQAQIFQITATLNELGSNNPIPLTYVKDYTINDNPPRIVEVPFVTPRKTRNRGRHRLLSADIVNNMIELGIKDAHHRGLSFASLGSLAGINASERVIREALQGMGYDWRIAGPKKDEGKDRQMEEIVEVEREVEVVDGFIEGMAETCWKLKRRERWSGLAREEHDVLE
ncbi:hypothetical protein EV426DRAFT_721715 [Tirmania nivea]|nr:hypothetical protein EV426DRAFT_721715 [Tirmania nivea]